jgi:sugar phosphate isomerase/epimerase
MPFTAENWPIAAAMLPYGNVLSDGTSVQDADVSEWVRVLSEVADAGFTDVDLTDCWLRVGDLEVERLDELKTAAAEAGVGFPAISVIRRSVIDVAYGDRNLDYSHRTIDAAAALGVGMVSFGLHQALTSEQSRQLWFWTVEGYRDPAGDVEMWSRAVTRLRDLGRHAEGAGLLVSLELYEDTYLGTGDSAVRLVEEIGLHNVGLNPDIGNLVRLHRPVEDWREILAKVLPYTNYWHVKNYHRDEDVARGSYVAFPASLEAGVINYREAFRMAIANGYQGVICTEHYGGDGLSVCATNREYLRRRVLPKVREYDLGSSRVTQQSRFPGL